MSGWSISRNFRKKSDIGFHRQSHLQNEFLKITIFFAALVSHSAVFRRHAFSPITLSGWIFKNLFRRIPTTRKCVFGIETRKGSAVFGSRWWFFVSFEKILMKRSNYLFIFSSIQKTFVFRFKSRIVSAVSECGGIDFWGPPESMSTFGEIG